MMRILNQKSTPTWPQLFKRAIQQILTYRDSSPLPRLQTLESSKRCKNPKAMTNHRCWSSSFWINRKLLKRFRWKYL